MSKPEMVFAVLALIFGTASAFLVPQLAVNDEGAHFLRSYSIASGEVRNINCSYPKEVVDAANNGDNIVAINSVMSFTKGYSQRISLDDANTSPYHGCGSASSYTPIMHLPQAIGVLLGKLVYPSVGVMIILGRIMNVLFYAFTLYFVVKHVRFGKWPLVVIALLPSMIHLTGSLSSDVMNNVVVISYIAFMFNLFSQKRALSRMQIISLLLLSCLLSLTKLPNIVFLLPIIFLPNILFSKTANTKRNQLLIKWGIAILCGGIALIAVVAWQATLSSALIDQAPNNPLVSRPWHFLRILFNTYIDSGIGYNDLLFRGITNMFSFKYGLPNYTLVIVWGTLLSSMLLQNSSEERTIKRRELRNLGIAMLLASVCYVLVVTYALYTMWGILPSRLGPEAAYADGVQGRYFIVLLALLIPFGMYIRRYVSVKTNSVLLGSVIITIGCVFQLVFYIIETCRFAF